MSIAEIKKPGRPWTMVFDGFLVVLYSFEIVTGGEGGIGGFPCTGGQGRRGARKEKEKEDENEITQGNQVVREVRACSSRVRQTGNSADGRLSVRLYSKRSASRKMPITGESDGSWRVTSARVIEGAGR